LRQETFLVSRAGLTSVHADFADDAIAEVADLAGEDVAVLLGGEEAAPGTGCGWARAILCVAFAAGFCCFVEPPEEGVSTSSPIR